MDYSYNTTAGSSEMHQLRFEFADKIADAYAMGTDFDGICEVLEIEEGYSITNTAWVWDVLSQDRGLIENQLTRLTDWIKSSQANYQRFDRLVHERTPDEISDRLQKYSVDNDVVLVHPSLINSFIDTQCDCKRLSQHWLSRDATFRANFYEALRTTLTFDKVDDDLGLDTGTTRQLLKWNPGPRRVYCNAHPGHKAAKDLENRTKFESLVQEGRTYTVIMNETQRSKRSMADAWADMHPLIQAQHVWTCYHSPDNARIQSKPYDQGGDRYEPLPDLAPPVIESD